MRLIFICLLVVNVGIAVWGFFLRSDGVARSSADAPVSTIVTKIDGDGVSAGAQSMELGEESATVEDPSAAKRLCEIVGPFDDDTLAANFVERLRSIDVPAAVENMELPAGASYWLHLAPEDSVALAFKKLAEVQSQGIESYVVGRGELKNAISLGVFTYQNLAEDRAAELKKAGLDPIIRKVQRTQVEVWVTIQPENAAKISDLTWSRLLEGMDSQERRQNFCLPVAS